MTLKVYFRGRAEQPPSSLQRQFCFYKLASQNHYKSPACSGIQLAACGKLICCAVPISRYPCPCYFSSSVTLPLQVASGSERWMKNCSCKDCCESQASNLSPQTFSIFSFLFASSFFCSLIHFLHSSFLSAFGLCVHLENIEVVIYADFSQPPPSEYQAKLSVHCWALAV